MKKTITLICVFAGLSGIQSVHATPSDTGASQKTKSAKVKKTASTQTKPKQAVHYITSVRATGSHLPLIVYSYDGRYYSQSAAAIYDAGQLTNTGQLSVSGELIQRDPAIGPGIGRR